MIENNMASPSQRIVIFSPNEDLFKPVKEILLPKYDYIFRSDKERVIEDCADVSPIAVVIDGDTLEWDALNLVTRLKDNQFSRHFPVIVTTAQIETSLKIAYYDAGVCDVIQVPFNKEEFVARVNAQCRQFELQFHANPLTGLAGPELVDLELKRYIHAKQLFGACYLDLVNFKAYVERYGYLKGDQVIYTVAKILVDGKQKLGLQSDLIGHLDADNFVYITTPVKARQICAHFVAEFESIRSTFYETYDYNRGYIKLLNRQACFEKFPLMKMFIAVVTNAHRKITTTRMVEKIAKQISLKAKTIETSGYVIDKRKK